MAAAAVAGSLAAAQDADKLSREDVLALARQQLTSNGAALTARRPHQLCGCKVGCEGHVVLWTRRALVHVVHEVRGVLRVAEFFCLQYFEKITSVYDVNVEIITDGC